MKLAGVPTVKPGSLAVLVRVSCGRFTVVLAVAVLLPAHVTGAPLQSGSAIPAGGNTVAVWLKLAAALAFTAQAIVRVRSPLPAASAAPLQVPVPVNPAAIVPTLKVPTEGV